MTNFHILFAEQTNSVTLKNKAGENKIESAEINCTSKCDTLLKSFMFRINLLLSMFLLVCFAGLFDMEVEPAMKPKSCDETDLICLSDSTGKPL